jgi:hypothetical protein
MNVPAKRKKRTDAEEEGLNGTGLYVIVDAGGLKNPKIHTGRGGGTVGAGISAPSAADVTD